LPGAGELPNTPQASPWRTGEDATLLEGAVETERAVLGERCQEGDPERAGPSMYFRFAEWLLLSGESLMGGSPAG